jgi:hypothetical protein
MGGRRTRYGLLAVLFLLSLTACTPKAAAIVGLRLDPDGGPDLVVAVCAGDAVTELEVSASEATPGNSTGEDDAARRWTATTDRPVVTVSDVLVAFPLFTAPPGWDVSAGELDSLGDGVYEATARTQEHVNVALVSFESSDLSQDGIFVGSNRPPLSESEFLDRADC